MRAIYTYILLFAITFNILVKIGVISRYALLYNYYKLELCENKAKPKLQCNGSCQLEKEISTINISEQKAGNVQETIQSFVFSPVFNELIDEVTLKVKLIDLGSSHCFCDKTSKGFLKNILPPPQFV